MHAAQQHLDADLYHDAAACANQVLLHSLNAYNQQDSIN